MSKNVPLIGVSTVVLSAPNPAAAALPSLITVNPVASANTPVTRVNNEVRSDLTTGVAYQVVLACMGYDIVNGGWCIGVASQPSGSVTLSTAGQGIAVNVPNGSWPGGMFTAGDHRLVAVFLKAGAGSYTLCDFAYVDPSNNFNFLINAQPFSGTPTRSLAFLQAASTDSVFVSRAPYPGAETSVGVTSGGVTIDRGVSQANISPDNAPDYSVVTSRSCNVTFSSLQNNVVDIVRGSSGLYAQFTAIDGNAIQVAQSTMLTASAVLKGNAMIVINEPADSYGISATRLLLGNLTISQTQVTISRNKTSPALVNYNLQTAAVDGLLVNMNSEVVYAFGL